MRRSILVLACGAAALAACSSGSKKSTHPTTTTTTRPSTTSSSSTTAAPATSAPAGSTTTRPTTPTGVVACGNQMPAIVSAIGGASGAPAAGTYTVTNCRIASASAIWAAAAITPKPGGTTRPTTVVLERIGATWNVEGMGASGIGCDAPKAVQQELQLICPA